MNQTPASNRSRSIDLLRGFVMVLMALDHTRDFFSTYSPPGLAHSSLTFFVTRWITHLCAPTFVFLAGMGARLSVRDGDPPSKLRDFLIQRGLWLIIVEILIISPAWRGSLAFSGVPLQVIWALGWSMICLSLVITLPEKLIAVLALAIIFFHNLFDSVSAGSLGSFASLWSVLHGPGEFWIGLTKFKTIYPLVPWIGVMMAGYVFGAWWKRLGTRRAGASLQLGLTLLALFLILRFINVYGDTNPWTNLEDLRMTIQSFLDVRKYPPSLDYCLVTLGISLCLLAGFEKWNAKFLEPIDVFGRVPMFYYILHLHIIHLLAFVVACVWSRSITSYDLLNSPPPGWGFGFPAVYALWALIVVGLYPLCRWYAGVKAKSKNPLLRFL